MKQSQSLIFILTIFLTAYTFSSVIITPIGVPRDFFVDASRPDDSGDGDSWETAKKTIQAAIDLTIDGDTVWVTNGTYVLSTEISVTNAITIRSVNGPNVTIVDGGGSNRCFYLSAECRLNGFTVTHGTAYDKAGGGICCAGTAPVVSNCLVVSNETLVIYLSWGFMGGGMYEGTAIDCVFESNGAYDGGGKCGGRAYRCVFTKNYGFNGQWGESFGAGMSHGEAYDCLFVGNAASFRGFGAGMYEGTAFNCTFISNRIYSGGGALGYSTAYNCVFKGNEDADGFELYCSDVYNSCSVNLTQGENGNITNAPLFVDAENGDFRLQSNSPCINWGNNAYVTNATDLDGNLRVVESTVDMGAYEYQGTVGLADSDNDGINDDWERSHGGNQSPERTCSNGVNTLLQAYVAGLDPNDSQSKFTAAVSGQILRWNAASGRVYAVYYSTNLISGFQPLATNIPWTAGCFTDSVYNAHGQLFYKIDVKLEDAGDGNPFLPPGGGDIRL